MATFQRMSVAFHLVTGIFYSVSTYLDLQISTPGVNLYGGRWKYLTFLNLMIQLSYFVLSSVIDVIILGKGKSQSQKFIQFRDLFFSAVAFPFGVFVMATFWGIYTMDRELIFPAELDKIVPSWLNHVLHTWCGVLMIMEAMIVKHEYSRNRIGITLLLLLGIAYMAWVLWIAHAADIWVYPFLKVMPHGAKAAFFVMCAGVLSSFYLSGKWLTNIVHCQAKEGAVDSASGSRNLTKKKVKKAE